MKIGVVCEGETDFVVIKHYVGEELDKRGIQSEFVLIQPAADRSTRGGWGNVIAWLDKNPPQAREVFFGGGLFAGMGAKANLDVLLMQLDTDVLPEASFTNFVKGRGLTVSKAATVAEKSAEISRLLNIFARMPDVKDHLTARHIPVPIAEASEAWCVAAEGVYQGDSEYLFGQDLRDAFGSALARALKHEAKTSYSGINKIVKTRERYCLATKGEIHNVYGCTLFTALVGSLVERHKVK